MPDAADDAKRGAGRKKLKSYRLSEEKIARAREILGAPTATAAIETALDMVAFRQELLDGVAALDGLRVAPFDAAPPDGATSDTPLDR